MKTAFSFFIVLLGLASALSSKAAEINVSDLIQTPTADATQQNDISTPNGGVVNDNVDGTLSYYVATFTFGADSEAHLDTFFELSAGQDRVGVRANDTGVFEFINTGDPGRTNFDLNPLNNGTTKSVGEMAGETVTILVRSYWHSTNDALRATLGTSDDILMNVWVNPTGSATETAVSPGDADMLADGDMHTLWNASDFFYLTQRILNQGTPGTGGNNTITDTVLLTGANATFANALALATGSGPPTGMTDAGSSTVSASPTAVPADGVTTSTITVTLKDSGGNPVPGKQVSLAGDGNATINTSDNTSDASGVVAFTVWSTSVGTEVFTATDVTDSVVVTQTASVEFEEVIPVGPVDAGQSSVAASPTSIPANGIATATVTVTLRDASGNLVTGEGVSLGGSPATADISPAGPQATDGSGEATFAVSSTSIGTVTFTATSSTDSVVVTQTADVDFVDPSTLQSFNVKFLDEGQAEATGLVGVVGGPSEIWNQGTVSVSALRDATFGVTSSVAVSGLGNDGRLISGTALSLFNANRGLFDKGGDVTIDITGLTPDAAYDLYIYALSHNTGSWEDISNTERAAGDFVTSNTVTGNGQSQFLDNGASGTNGDAFVLGGNYVVFEGILADGAGNISVMVDAYDGIDGDPATNDGDTRLHVNGLQIRPASGESVDYTAWRDTYYPGLGLPEEDDDGDRLSNDYERIFGLDPTSGSSVNPYSVPFDPATGSFGYTRRTKSLINMNYKVWYSTDLEQWFEDNAADQVADSVTNDVEFMGVEIDPALLAEPELYVQVRATPVSGIDLEPSVLNVWGSSDTVTVLFSEPMNSSSAGNLANYSVVQDGVGTLGVTSATLSSDGGSVTLTLDSTLAIDSGYTVSIDGVTSGTGQSLGGLVERQFRTWDDDPAGVKVFILAGQSNMVGRGESERGNGDVDGAIGSLRHEVVTDNANYGQLVVDSGSPATDPWKVRDDVNFWWNRADIGGSSNVSKGGLNPEGFGSGPETFGPEYGFGWAVGEHYSEPVLVIKTAWGGKDLFNNFRPPSAVAARGGVVGGYYIEMIEQVREVLNDLGTEFPEWADSGYQIAGFGWHQGWNDSLNPFAANEYEANMANFITDIRGVFGKPNLPFSIGTTGMVGAATSGNRLTVVNAQINVANPTLHPELGGNVFTVDTRPFARTTAESPTNDTTHWKNNGESMYLIGKGMGDGMVGLLAP